MPSFSRASLVVALLVASTALAKVPCEDKYKWALTSLGNGQFPEDVAHAMRMRVQSAWRLHLATEGEKAGREIDAAHALIDSPTLKGLFAEERDVQRAPLQSLRDCMRNAPAVVATATDVLPAYIRAVGIIDGVLPEEFTSLTLRIMYPTDEPLPIATLKVLEMVLPSGSHDVAAMWRLRPSGEIVLQDRAAFAVLVDASREMPFELRAHATDRLGKTHVASKRFVVGRHNLTITVIPPAGRGAAAADVAMRITHVPSQFSFWEKSNARGRVSFPALLPAGDYEVVAGGKSAGSGQRNLVLDDDKEVELTLYQFEKDSWGRIEHDGSVVPMDTPQSFTRIAAMTIDVTADGSLKVRSLDTIDWPSDSMAEQASETALREIETHFETTQDPPTHGSWVTARAFDSNGRVVDRQAIRVVDDAPAGQTPMSLAFRYRVPMSGTDRIELRGWLKDQRANWSLEALRIDPKIEHAEALQKQ